MVSGFEDVYTEHTIFVHLDFGSLYTHSKQQFYKLTLSDE